MKKLKINWEPFWEQTSSREELSIFAQGESSLKTLESHLYTEACLVELKKMKKLPVKIARQRALAACKRHGCY